MCVSDGKIKHIFYRPQHRFRINGAEICRFTLKGAIFCCQDHDSGDRENRPYLPLSVLALCSSIFWRPLPMTCIVCQHAYRIDCAHFCLQIRTELYEIQQDQNTSCRNEAKLLLPRACNALEQALRKKEKKQHTANVRTNR